jgi:hypothetical protein
MTVPVHGPSLFGLTKGGIMKKILIALIFGLVFLPLTATGQKWIEPYTKSDGTQVEGHWRTPEEARQERNADQGKINPYPGGLNPYTNRFQGSSPTNPNPHNPNFVPNYQGDYRYKQQDYRYRP